MLAARWALTDRVGVLVRGEWYADDEQIIVVTGGPDALRATGGSVGLDVTPTEGLLWRTELRYLGADAEIFADRDAFTGRSKSNLVIVTAFTLRM